MIIRRSRNSNFTIVPNEPINNEALPFDALGLLTYLLSRPDHWRVHLAQLRKRGRLGRDRAQRLMRSLIDARYVVRQRLRDDGTKQFGCYEYVVYDEPQRAGEPQPENPAMADSLENEPQPENPEPAFPATENQAALVNTDLSNIPYGENPASSEAGADAPLTRSAMIWKEGRALLQTSGLSEPKARNILGKWCKRASSEEKKGKLVAVIRAAVKAGTGDPVAYIEAAIKTELPAPPDPKSFTRDRWALNGVSAIKFRQWPPEWGPRPGKPGCLMPKELQTPELFAAIQKQAA